MNILNLGFKYDIKIDFDGDVDGGSYDMTIKYQESVQHKCGQAEFKVCLAQSDIDEIYEGAKKLVKSLENHVSEGY